MQSPENSQKPQFGQFFDDFEVKYPQIANFSEKQVSFKLKVIFSTNFRPKTKKTVGIGFERNIKVSEISRCFREYLQIKIFFFNNAALRLFYFYSPLTSCKKSEKFFESFLRKLRYKPTNQQHRFCRTSLTPVQKNCVVQDIQEWIKQNLWS